jgi:hypothetical protein
MSKPKTAPAMPVASSKICAACARETPRSKMKKAGGGAIGSICKTCDAARSRAWYAAHREDACRRKRERYAVDPEIRRRHRERDRARTRSLRGRELNALAVARWRARHPHKAAASRTLREAVKRGAIVRPSVCQAQGCSAPAELGHHQDYGRPLDATFLCRDCHESTHHQGPQRLKPGVKRKFARAPAT